MKKILQFNQTVEVVSNTPPVGKVEKKQILKPVRDGYLSFVDFENPFEEISASSYSIKSQLANGGNLKQVPVTPLEGVYGSDAVRMASESLMSKN